MNVEAELNSPFARELADQTEHARQKLLAARKSWRNNLAVYEAKAAELREQAGRYDFEATMAREELHLIGLQLEKLT